MAVVISIRCKYCTVESSHLDSYLNQNYVPEALKYLFRVLSRGSEWNTDIVFQA